MKKDFRDIRKAIPVDPYWYDELGTPRYDVFHPTMLGVYDNYAVYGTIECQACGEQFEVGAGSTGYSAGTRPWTLKDIVEKYHYGDPPIHECVGDTMMSENFTVLQAWEHDHAGDWNRVSALETVILSPEAH